MIKFTPYRFTPGKVPPNTRWTGGCVDPRTVMECSVSEMRKFLASPVFRTPDPPTLIRRYTGCAILVSF